MTLEMSEKRRALLKVLLAFAINAVFLAIMLTCYSPRFETNDDVLMSKFVDGQMAHKTMYVNFINITLGFILKTLYTIGGDGINWYSVCQYGVLFFGFTAITWVLLRRFKLLPALTMTAIILCVFAADSYLAMNFSKAAGIGTVGGFTLMFYAMRNETGRVMRCPLILGILLTVYGFIWRFEEFFACAAIIAGLGLYALIEIGAENRGDTLRNNAKKMLRYALPFILVFVIAFALLGINQLAWTNREYGEYYTFDWTRSILIDSVVPDYSQMPQVYDSIDWDENTIKLFRQWAFYDTDKITTDSMQTVIDARGEFVHYPNVGEILGTFIAKCIPGFYKDRPFAGFLFMLMLFFACGKREPKQWITAAWFAVSFAGMYFAFIYADRYLVNRIDIGLFLALSVGLTWLMDEEKLREEKLICLALILGVLFVGSRNIRRDSRLDSHSLLEDHSSEKAAIQRIIDDDEHIYFVKYLSVNHELYTPLETAPKGYADKILFIGGWSCRHPEIERVLNECGITNPYADIVGSDKIYIIDNDIETTMAYINKYHDADAVAEKVEPMSTETSLNIYRILDGEK